MLEISIGSRAQYDLENIYTYLGVVAKNPKAAAKTVQEIHAAVEKAAEMPGVGSPLDTEENLEHGYRRLLVGKYWVYYSEEGGFLRVWRVFHTSQEVGDFDFIDL